MDDTLTLAEGADFEVELELGELDEPETVVEIEQLVAGVRGARLAGA